MSRTCAICWAWQPKVVTGAGAKDVTALCKVCNAETHRDYTCPLCGVLPPTGDKTPPKVKLADVATKKKRTSKLAQPVVVNHKGMKTVELFNHQQQAVDKFRDNDYCCLFFEMGCGKTITALTIIKEKYQRGLFNRVLVVAPNDVHRQWYQDLVNPNPEVGTVFDFDVHVQCVGGRGGAKDFVDPPDNMLAIAMVNIDTMSTNKWSKVVEWTLADASAIIIDEATAIKNKDSLRSQRMLYGFNHVAKRGKVITASQPCYPYRMILTGTPVTNGAIDLWAMMEFVKPNFFGRNYYSFRNRYSMLCDLQVSGDNRTIKTQITPKIWQAVKDCDNFETANYKFGVSHDTFLTIKTQDKYMGPYKHVEELREAIDYASVFAKLVDCVDMPATNYIIRDVGMNATQEKLYRDMKKNLMSSYAAADGMTVVTHAKNTLVASLRLQQISSGFIVGRGQDTLPEDATLADMYEHILDQDYTPDQVVWLGESVPKLDALMRDIEELDKPVLVLTRYTAEAAKIYDMLKDKYRTGLFTGWKVIGGIDEFKAGNIDVLVANSNKIHRGFNLQNAHTTLFYSNTYSMEVRQQSEFRTFRIGQTCPCTYVDYMAAGIDQIIYDALRIKKNLLDVIRDGEVNQDTV